MFLLELRFDYWSRKLFEQFAREHKLVSSCTAIMDNRGQLTGTLELPDETTVYEPFSPAIEYFRLPNGKMFFINQGDIPQTILKDDICHRTGVDNIDKLEWLPIRHWQQSQMERLRFIAEAGL